MVEREIIKKLVLRAVQDFNQQQAANEHIQESSVLYGKGGLLDSLELVNLIVAVEQRISDDLQKDITLADRRALSQKGSPFRTVTTLIEYVCLRLNEDDS